MRIFPAFGLATLIVLITMSGCIDYRPNLGPLQIAIVGWHVDSDNAPNLTVTTRLTNAANEPLWRIEVGIHATYYVDDAFLYASVIDPRGEFAYMYRGLLGAHEVLRPMSYVDRTVELVFGNPQKNDNRPPLPRYDPSYSVDYESAGRAWSYAYYPCDRLENGEEHHDLECEENPWSEFHPPPSEYQGRPNETVEIGTPIEAD